jgi:hypothetical protein
MSTKLFLGLVGGFLLSLKTLHSKEQHSVTGRGIEDGPGRRNPGLMPAWTRAPEAAVATACR